MLEAAERLRAMVDAGKCTGAAAILTDATQSIEVEANGTTRADDGVAITERTRFRWASCSKPVTAVATIFCESEMQSVAPTRAGPAARCRAPVDHSGVQREACAG